MFLRWTAIFSMSPSFASGKYSAQVFNLFLVRPDFLLVFLSQIKLFEKLLHILIRNMLVDDLFPLAIFQVEVGILPVLIPFFPLAHDALWKCLLAGELEKL
jgi:hypothetical protein